MCLALLNPTPRPHDLSCPAQSNLRPPDMTYLFLLALPHSPILALPYPASPMRALHYTESELCAAGHT